MKNEKKDVSERQFKFAKMIATFCGIGNIKYAPGTFGSLATFPLFVILSYLFLLLKLESFWQLLVFYLVILAAIFYKGLWATEIYLNKVKKDDPQEVVIDEVVGQLIAFIIPTLFAVYHFAYIVCDINFNANHLIIVSLILTILPIAFFRLFDIGKPGLVKYFDTKVNNAFGVMMDDVIAGFYAGITVGLILSIFLLTVACMIA